MGKRQPKARRARSITGGRPAVDVRAHDDRLVADLVLAQSLVLRVQEIRADRHLTVDDVADLVGLEARELWDLLDDGILPVAATSRHRLATLTARPAPTR